MSSRFSADDMINFLISILFYDIIELLKHENDDFINNKVKFLNSNA